MFPLRYRCRNAARKNNPARGQVAFIRARRSSFCPALRSDRNMVNPAAIFSAVRLQPANSRYRNLHGFSPAPRGSSDMPMRHEDVRNACGRAPLITAYPIILRYADDISANRSPILLYRASKADARIHRARYTLHCGNIIPSP